MAVLRLEINCASACASDCVFAKAILAVYSVAPSSVKKCLKLSKAAEKCTLSSHFRDVKK